ncbi:uncharacterized protein FOMMEDRAFT_29209 [Fomitiporia mediterranea MF3/22]|uniref:uncharacterized protein n=1 Tax=Fomitiporia mediterranea (strain MF3/22) TaxID=694068 RepID=UPI0004407C9F|nr:uncharacterized protein FOMMEDRAFT_29209 [Fomitiporia mediterranea MF3/22]EJD02113.1 hypothetical protein FOMMEDRAFT_29209 [Fomitiporia mediterranea MF3/22]
MDCTSGLRPQNGIDGDYGKRVDACLASDAGSRIWTIDVWSFSYQKYYCFVQDSKQDLTDSGLKKVGVYIHQLVHCVLVLDAHAWNYTGDHNVGVGKKEYLKDEHNPGIMELMRRVKNVMDPSSMMNLGKAG